ncbi:MAG: hypothetical protein ACREMA_04635 [Longimicrobiales bacterium]
MKHATAAASRFYQLALSNVSAPDTARRIKQQLAELLFASSRFDDAIPFLRDLADSEHSEHDEVSWRWKHLYSRVGSRPWDAYELLAEANRLEEQARRVGHPEALYHALRAQVIVECRQLSDHTLGRQRTALLELSEQYPETRVGTMACRLAADHIAGTEDAFKGLAHADTARRWAESIGEPELLIECLRSVAMTQYFCGRVREARTTMHSALGVVERSGAVLYQSLILPKLISIVVELDAREETEQLIESVERLDAQRDWNDLAMSLANRAVLLYHNGEYVQCADVCKSSASASKAGSWLEVGVRGVLGLCLLEIGSMHEALREADHLKVLLSTTDVIHGDISYPLMLIARIAGLQRTERDVEELIRRKHHQYATRDYVCRSRIQLALGETIARRSSTESLALVSEVVQEAEARGLKALLDQGNATMRRIGRRTGVPRMANTKLHTRSFA